MLKENIIAKIYIIYEYATKTTSYKDCEFLKSSIAFMLS